MIGAFEKQELRNEIEAKPKLNRAQNSIVEKISIKTITIWRHYELINLLKYVIVSGLCK